METLKSRKAYPSDLTERQWELLKPLIPAIGEEAANVVYTRREIVNGILYVLRSGCPWRLVPHDLPAWGTLYWYFRRWRNDGIWDEILHALRRQLRQKQGRDAEPSAAVIDSQSIKTSAVRGPEKGYDAGKKIWGRKRHVLVDTQGNLLAVKVNAASGSDLQGARRMLKPLKQLFPRLKLLWGDSHYGGSLLEWIKEHLGWNVQVVRGLIKPRESLPTQEMTDDNEQQRSVGGFHILPRRWVVERSFAWITRWRRLTRDHEGLPQSSEAFIMLSASRRMLSLLAPTFP
jgi:putative transposase